MREIKFRAWNKEGKNYTYDIQDGVPYPETDRCFCSYMYSHKTGGDIIIEQYTGLKDKNGKEIYEGDIVKYEDNEGNDRIMTVPSIEEVYKCIEYEYFFLQYKTPEHLVVGNIHENPELLKDVRP